VNLERLLTHPRTRAWLAFVGLFGVSLIAGWAIFTGEKKLLAVLGLVTLHLFLRRWHFSDFYLLTLLCAALSHVHFAVIQDEFERDKWLALFAMAGVAVLTMLLKWRSRPWPSLIHVPVLALLGFVVWSVSWSLRPWLSFQKAGVFGLGVIIAFGGAWAYASGAKQVRKILDAQINVLWMVFPLSVIVWMLPIPGKYAGAGRFRAIFGNANALGVWASMSLPLVFALMLTHPSLIRRRISGLMLVTGAFVAFLTGSRGGVGGALIGIGIYSVLRWPKRNVMLGVGSAIFLFFIFAYEVDLGYVSEKVEHLVRPKTLTTLSDRTIAWEAAIYVGNHAPWRGHGFGLEDILYAEFGQSFVGTSASAVHSTYLATYMTLGKIGTGLLILVIAAASLMGLDCWRKDKTGEHGLLALACACGVLSGAAHGVVENIFFSLGNPWSLPFWTVMALSARLWALQRRRLRAESKARVRRPRARSALPEPAPAGLPSA
jgi:hypothetical protein